MNEEPRYITHQDIDKERWDACILQAECGRIYAFSYYLDTMSPGWDALVWKDYQVVMPLTWRRKYGIHYLFQPFLAAQLGPMGRDAEPLQIQAFLQAIPSRYRYIDISFNPCCVAKIDGYPFLTRMNLVLPLAEPYSVLQSRYNENIRRNLRKAAESGAEPKKGIPVNEVIRLAISQMKGQGQETSENIQRFRELYAVLEKKGMTANYGIYSGDTLLASAVFFFSHQRAYYILVGNDPAGRDSGASHALIDAFIRDHTGQALTLDFEGSDIPGLAAFYAAFGARPEPYPALRLNRLPFWLKWLKS